MCNLRDFLTTGSLGKIHLGACLEDVKNLLHEPILSARIKPNIELWQYEDLELMFESGKIKQIKVSLNNNYNPQIPSNLTKEVWPINQSMRIEELLDLIDNYKISWRVNEKWSFDRQLCLVTEEKVLLFLDLDRREFRSIVVTNTR